MPRDPGGLYFLPAGNPVITGTIIESDWANPTMSDIGQELSDSLSRSGKGGMLAALRGLDGSAAVPTFSFTNEPATGRYRAGPGQIVESVDGTPVVRYLATGLEQWDSDIMDWVPLTPRDAAGTPFDPAPSNLTSTNVQAAIEEVNDKTGGVLDAANVLYDDTNVYFPAATVQQAIDRLGADFSGLANDVLDNADAIIVLDGELTLLTNRVSLNETNIGNNTTEISLLDTRVTNNSIDIDNLESTQSSILLEQQVQNSDIAQNETSIDFVYNITQDNADQIGTNSNAISVNQTDINSLDGRLDAYDGIFPGGVLRVINGGTGVTLSTGTGRTVLSDSPVFTGFLDLANPYCLTPPAGEDSTRMPTTAWVMDRLEGITSDPEIYYGSNANGRYCWFSTVGVIIQWGERANSGSVTQYFPVAVNSGITSSVMIQQLIAGGGAPWDTAPVITTKTPDGFIVRTDHHFGWLMMGQYP